MMNLHKIANKISDYDVVGLLELDGGSLRTSFINYAEYLAKEARFPHWFEKVNRKWGSVAQHSMGLLSKVAPIEISRHNLPSKMPGRGALVVKYGNLKDPFGLVLVHLSLGRRARFQQMEYVKDLIRGFRHVVLMGDFNCGCDSREISILLEQTDLRMPYTSLNTYPSWNPRKHIDHILVSSSIKIDSVKVLDWPISDHLPIAMDLSLPDGVVAPCKDILQNRAA
jgi:endonuclease/exonuclease/phosphatase family metal-dependent hydrolase